MDKKELTWKKYKVNIIAKILVSLQHILIVPLAVLIGRFNIYIISLHRIIMNR